VPDINSLLSEPARITQLSTEEIRAVIVQLASLLLLLSTRASAPPVSALSSPDTGIWLSAEQVYQRYGLEASWLHEHRKQLGSLGVTSRVSRKTTLYDVKKLSRFIESRRQSGATNNSVALNR
jgi:hypothetical protein